jgi:hypothetical protein
MWLRISACWLAAAALLAGPTTAATLPGGIYAIVDAVSPAQDNIAKQALATAGVDGLLIHLRWNAISKTKEQYNWSSLDRVVKLAANAGKRFEIGVVTGGALPTWITAPKPAGMGAKHATFYVDASVANGCTSFVMAAPYDLAYLAAFGDMMRQLAQHLRATKTYNRLGMLKLDGIATTTDELRLPAVNPCSGGTAKNTDPVKTWQGLGYTPAKAESAWNTMLQQFLKHFPDKSFDIGFIGINAFPGIKADGTAASSKGQAEYLSAQFAAKLIADAGAAMPGHLSVGFDSLVLNLPPGATSYPKSMREFMAAAAGANARLGWQTNELLGNYPGGGAACGGTTLANAVPCTGSPQFREMLFRGIYPEGLANTPPAKQGVYLELFPQNIVAYPKAVATAHANLASWGGG